MEQVDGGPIDRNFDELEAFTFVPGQITLWPGSVQPDGWLECDGSYYLRRELPDLFGVIGTDYGTTTADNFRVPTLAPIGTVVYMIRT